jgi:hypothetical protein
MVAYSLQTSFPTDNRINTMDKTVSRRAIVKGGLMAGALIPALGLFGATAAEAAGAELPPLDANDPTAKALGYVTDTTKVDGAANPTHTAAQKCGTCAQFTGKPGDARGGCNVFTGHSVGQGGWCKVWAKKPA